MINNTGVHAAHCCKECGCKYGEEECPVALGQVNAYYDCSECADSFEQLIEQVKNLPVDKKVKLFDILHHE